MPALGNARQGDQKKFKIIPGYKQEETREAADGNRALPQVVGAV